ncbi:geranylgeranylglyceryl/heptaprenylglyceryl phosphate synthase [Carboxylicivirga taeanensis]|uniref:geranylgeranylglyceryl/heptaprenylglyceryl phosphate synthase n=1 Tax=Carboxylicivirga taeanensis TaxID=1416875 RepID=UPI003F6E06BA
MVYEQINKIYKAGRKQLAFLIDPDKFSFDSIAELKSVLQSSKPDLILVGGSLISVDTSAFVKELKQHISQPVVLYPGSSVQICREVDAMLFLSLISGRNPEFLISHHVAAAPHIKANNIEAISTGYMLIDGGSNTSVQYISQTQAIPSDKYDIAVATALAGAYLGMKLIYMDAGSGARRPVAKKMIEAVREAIDVPLMVGGGIRTPDDLHLAFQAGADIVVIGNVLEQDLSLLNEFRTTLNQFNK